MKYSSSFLECRAAIQQDTATYKKQTIKTPPECVQTARNTMPAALYGSRDRKQLISGFWFRRVRNINPPNVPHLIHLMCASDE